MQKGLTLKNLANKIQLQAKAKRDFMADTEAIRMAANGQILQIRGGSVDGLEFDISKTAHRQIGQELEIPAKYYDKLRDNFPSLLAQNVNTWLHAERKKQMLRTFDFSKLREDNKNINEQNRIRAFLSSKYRPLDNVDLINELVPLIKDKGADIVSCNVTESHLYIHAVFPDIEAEIKEGDVVRSGILIRNSEVGLSALKVQPWIERLKCMNGLICVDTGVKKYHVGKSQIGSDLAYELMSDSTKRKTDKAFWSQVQDVVKATITKSKFETICKEYRRKANVEVAEPATAVEITSNQFKLSTDESKSMLQHLCEGGDYSTWGIANAVTRMAHDVDSYDRAVELEEIGGHVMELPANTWE